MQLVARGVAVEFGQPPFAPVRGRRAVFAAAMPMPETAVDKDRHFVFGKKNVHRDSTRSSTPHLFPLPGRGGEENLLRASRIFAANRFRVFCVFRGYGDADMEAKAVAQPMQQGTYDAFRRRVLAANARHVPRTALTRQVISTLTRSATTLSHPMGEGQRTALTRQAISVHVASLARCKGKLNRSKQSKRRRFPIFVSFPSVPKENPRPSASFAD